MITFFSENSQIEKMVKLRNNYFNLKILLFKR